MTISNIPNPDVHQLQPSFPVSPNPDLLFPNFLRLAHY